MKTPPARRIIHNKATSHSPATDYNDVVDRDGFGTPGPTRERIRNLEKQVQELVRKYQTEQRKVEAEAREKNRRTEEWEDERALLRHQLECETQRAAALKAEAERSRAQGEIGRDEVHLLTAVQAQKASVAAADEGLQLLEMEFALQQASVDRLVREHKLSQSESRAADLLNGAAAKECRIAELELEAANTSMAHQRAAESKALVSSTRETKAEVTALEGQLEAVKSKLTALENAHRALGEKEAAACAEVRSLLEQQASADTANKTDDEIIELRAQLRAAKSEAVKHEKAAEAARDEAEETKSEYKEVLKTLKEKYRAAKADAVRLAGVEEELEVLKAAPVKKAPARKKATASETTTPEKKEPKKKPAKAVTPAASPEKPKKTRKTSPVADESEDEAPKKKARKSKPKPLQEADDNGQSEDDAPVKAKGAKATKHIKVTPAASEDEDERLAVPAPEKKKKRRILGGAAPAFTWDPILNSGDGVIPSFLSPVSGKGAGATIPRAGFSSLSARATRF